MPSYDCGLPGHTEGPSRADTIYRPYDPSESLSWLSDGIAHSGRLSQLKRLKLDNFCLCEHARGCTLPRITDVTKLEELSLSYFSVIKKRDISRQPEKFRLLCSLYQVHDMSPFCFRHWSDDEVTEFLLGCTTLQHLEVLNDRKIPLGRSHGASRSLSH